MGVRRRTVKDKTYKLEKEVKALAGKKVVVGVLGGGEEAWLAAIHEYGLKIEVTPKMRVWLHVNGLHLKAETKYINIPERAFLRNGFDEHAGKTLEETKKLLSEVLSGNFDVDKYCDTVGVLLTSKIKEFARDLKSPANHPFTIERKGSSNPLIDTGEMIRALTYEVEG